MPLCVLHTAHVPFRSPVTIREPSVLKVMFVTEELCTVLSSLISLSSSFQSVMVPSYQPIASAYMSGCHLRDEMGILLRTISKLGTTLPSSLIKMMRGADVLTASTILNSLLDHVERRACSPSIRT